MLEWLIIGGGMHGTYLSHFLTSRGGVSRNRLRVLDPHDTPLEMWRIRALNCGMEFLRSLGIHNLDVDPVSLFAFARTPEGRPYDGFVNVTHPSLALFHAHAEWVIRRHGLASLRLVGVAQGLSVGRDGIQVETADGLLETRRVVLALGPGDPFRPPWASRLRGRGAPVRHVFDQDFARHTLPHWSHAVVIGGGITAAETALTLARRSPGTVTLLARHPLRQHQYDAHPRWFGWAANTFGREGDVRRRRAIIQWERHRGSVPPEVTHALQSATAHGLLERRTGEVIDADSTQPGQIRLCLAGETGTILCDCVILATGFRSERPGGGWLDHVIEELGLPLSPCGYPVVDSALRWHRGIYVTGALADLELGPAARNIVGAQLAGERISAAC
jgi:glycine/D-amino acid oxidase-like deaminating enzyme